MTGEIPDFEPHEQYPTEGIAEGHDPEIDLMSISESFDVVDDGQWGFTKSYAVGQAILQSRNYQSASNRLAALTVDGSEEVEAQVERHTGYIQRTYDQAKARLDELEARYAEIPDGDGYEEARREIRNQMLTPGNTVKYHEGNLSAARKRALAELGPQIERRKKHMADVVESHTLVYGEFYDLNPTAFGSLVVSGGVSHFGAMCEEYGYAWQSAYEVTSYAERLSGIITEISTGTGPGSELAQLLSDLTQPGGISGGAWELAWERASQEDRRNGAPNALATAGRRQLLNELQAIVYGMSTSSMQSLEALRVQARNLTSSSMGLFES